MVMKTTDFKGIIPPLMTIFDKNGHVDEKAFREYIDFLVPQVDGFYPLGTYGCGPYMSLDERKRAAEIIVDQVNHRIPVIIHTGTCDPETAVELSKHAQEIGADAVGAIGPYYAPLKENEIIDYYLRLMESIDIPFFLYNNPHIAKTPITPAIIKKLADRGLRGIKDSSFDLVNYYNYYQVTKNYEGFNLIIGTEAIYNAAFQMGATGCVCGLANVFPEELKKLQKYNDEGDLEKANDQQLKILRLRDITKYGQTVSTMHAILKMRGVNGGCPRAPYLPIDDATYNKVEAALKEEGVL